MLFVSDAISTSDTYLCVLVTYLDKIENTDVLLGATLDEKSYFFQEIYSEVLVLSEVVDVISSSET